MLTIPGKFCLLPDHVALIFREIRSWVKISFIWFGGNWKRVRCPSLVHCVGGEWWGKKGEKSFGVKMEINTDDEDMKGIVVEPAAAYGSTISFLSWGFKECAALGIELWKRRLSERCSVLLALQFWLKSQRNLWTAAVEHETRWINVNQFNPSIHTRRGFGLHF